MITYPQNADLPDLGITWNSSSGTPFDFSVGWSLQVDIKGIYPSGAPLVMPSKTTGITALSGGVSPNVTIQWATSGEITILVPGNYTFQLKATNNTTNKVRYLNDILQITATF